MLTLVVNFGYYPDQSNLFCIYMKVYSCCKCIFMSGSVVFLQGLTQPCRQSMGCPPVIPSLSGSLLFTSFFSFI